MFRRLSTISFTCLSDIAYYTDQYTDIKLILRLNAKGATRPRSLPLHIVKEYAQGGEEVCVLPNLIPSYTIFACQKIKNKGFFISLQIFHKGYVLFHNNLFQSRGRLITAPYPHTKSNFMPPICAPYQANPSAITVSS